MPVSGSGVVASSVAALTAGLIVPVLRLLLNKAEFPQYEPSGPLAPQYDFIVVGGGTAGCVVASRLSEVGGWRVLLVEAGPKPPPETYVPGISLAASSLSDYSLDWDYTYVPQRNALKNYVDQTGVLQLGRVLGGTAAINGMIYSRGNRRDYDHWQALGNPGWDYLSVLPYFVKSEDYRGHSLGETEAYHGRGGPLAVTPGVAGPLTRAFLQGGLEMGYPVLDSNGPQQIGFTATSYTIRDGVRCSTAECYLKPASSRPNLHVLDSATVLQILFDDTKRAVGVKIEYNGKVVSVASLREVIVSAGVVASPKLLMLSGVGPRQHLQQNKIRVVADVPGVGQNLQDHIGVYGLSWTINKGFVPSLLERIIPSSFKQYLANRQGPLSTPPESVSAWVKISQEGDPQWTDAQIFLFPVTWALDKGLFTPRAFGVDRKVYEEYFREIYGREGFSLRPGAVRPKSRGSITLRSNDPREPPIVDPNYLSHPDDVRILVKGIKLALALGNTSSFVGHLGAKFHEKPLPGCEGEAYGSDPYWTCYVQHMATTARHLSGSCKMAPNSDPLGVVDHALRVRGVSGVRVVDASIMPTVTAGNTNAPTIMIAEKATDLIKDSWRNELQLNVPG